MSSPRTCTGLAMAAAIAVATPNAAAGQDLTPRAIAPQRFLVREPDGAIPGRRALLDQIHAEVRAGGTDLDARIRALESAGAAGRDALRSAVARHGGRVEKTFAVFGGAIAVVPPAAVDALRAEPAVGEIVAENAHGPHIRGSTSAANHAADVAHARWPAFRGRGATLALLDSGLDLACAATGSPHPAFLDPTAGDASRIAAAFGFAAPGDLEDLLGHGTAVAGVAVARDWDPSPLGDDGFAPLARVASFKITAAGGSTYTDGDLLAALDTVARERTRLGLSVLNLSWAGVPSPTSVTERALDELAHFFDVVVVVSAGNDGDLPNPTARSHGCTNALAVAGVHRDTHVVWQRSTYGPLLGDPVRVWPDLAAVGVALRTPAQDQPTGESVPWDGTSFAAPAVAGTALVLRGAAPGLSALDTRALLLASAANLAGANPSLGPSYYGAGLLRTDLAVEALSTAVRFHGQSSSGAPDQEVAIELPQGQDTVAVLTWDRTDVFRPTWDDLDLEVVAPDGRVVATADAARNLYERAVFVADAGGSYRLRVLGRNLVSPPVTWSLVVDENRGGLSHPGSYRPFGAPCAGSGINPSAGATVPAFTAGRFGTAKMAMPLASGPGRLLQIIDGRSLPPDLTVRALALRRDETSLGARGWRVDLAVRIGHTSRAAHAPLTAFDLNFDDPRDSAPVLDSAALDLPGVTGLPAAASDFDFVIPFDRPVVHDGVRNLVVDFRLRGHSRSSQPFGLFFDAELDLRTASVTSIGDPDAAVGVADPVGLVLALLDGMPSAATPRIGADRAPALGEPMQVVLREARPGAPAALVHGQSDAWWGPHPLPFDLGLLGASGCALLVSPDVLLPAAVGANGQARVDVTVPGGPLWAGATFYQQFLVLDPGANAFGVSASAGAAGRIGR